MRNEQEFEDVLKGLFAERPEGRDDSVRRFEEKAGRLRRARERTVLTYLAATVAVSVSVGIAAGLGWIWILGGNGVAVGLGIWGWRWVRRRH